MTPTNPEGTVEFLDASDNSPLTSSSGSNQVTVVAANNGAVTFQWTNYPRKGTVFTVKVNFHDANGMFTDATKTAAITFKVPSTISLTHSNGQTTSVGYSNKAPITIKAHGVIAAPIDTVESVKIAFYKDGASTPFVTKDFTSLSPPQSGSWVLDQDFIITPDSQFSVGSHTITARFFYTPSQYCQESTTATSLPIQIQLPVDFYFPDASVVLPSSGPVTLNVPLMVDSMTPTNPEGTVEFLDASDNSPLTSSSGSNQVTVVAANNGAVTFQWTNYPRKGTVFTVKVNFHDANGMFTDATKTAAITFKVPSTISLTHSNGQTTSVDFVSRNDPIIIKAHAIIAAPIPEVQSVNIAFYMDGVSTPFTTQVFASLIIPQTGQWVIDQDFMLASDADQVFSIGSHTITARFSYTPVEYCQESTTATSLPLRIQIATSLIIGDENRLLPQDNSAVSLSVPLLLDSDTQQQIDGIVEFLDANDNSPLTSSSGSNQIPVNTDNVATFQWNNYPKKGTVFAVKINFHDANGKFKDATKTVQITFRVPTSITLTHQNDLTTSVDYLSTDHSISLKAHGTLRFPVPDLDTVRIELFKDDETTAFSSGNFEVLPSQQQQEAGEVNFAKEFIINENGAFTLGVHTINARFFFTPATYCEESTLQQTLPLRIQAATDITFNDQSVVLPSSGPITLSVVLSTSDDFDIKGKVEFFDADTNNQLINLDGSLANVEVIKNAATFLWDSYTQKGMDFNIRVKFSDSNGNFKDSEQTAKITVQVPSIITITHQNGEITSLDFAQTDQPIVVKAHAIIKAPVTNLDHIKIAFYNDQEVDSFAVEEFTISNPPEVGEYVLDQEFTINGDSSLNLGSHRISAKLFFTPAQYCKESITEDYLSLRIQVGTKITFDDMSVVLPDTVVLPDSGPLILSIGIAANLDVSGTVEFLDASNNNSLQGNGQNPVAISSGHTAKFEWENYPRKGTEVNVKVKFTDQDGVFQSSEDIAKITLKVPSTITLTHQNGETGEVDFSNTPITIKAHAVIKAPVDDLADLTVDFFKDDEEEPFATELFTPLVAPPQEGEYVLDQDFTINSDKSLTLGKHSISAKLSWSPVKYYDETYTAKSLPLRIQATTSLTFEDKSVLLPQSGEPIDLVVTLTTANGINIQGEVEFVDASNDLPLTSPSTNPVAVSDNQVTFKWDNYPKQGTEFNVKVKFIENDQFVGDHEQTATITFRVPSTISLTHQDGETESLDYLNNPITIKAHAVLAAPVSDLDTIKIAFIRNNAIFDTQNFVMNGDLPTEGQFVLDQEFTINRNSDFEVGQHAISAKLFFTPEKYCEESFTDDSLPLRIQVETNVTFNDVSVVLPESGPITLSVHVNSALDVNGQVKFFYFQSGESLESSSGSNAVIVTDNNATFKWNNYPKRGTELNVKVKFSDDNGKFASSEKTAKITLQVPSTISLSHESGETESINFSPDDSIIVHAHAVIKGQVDDLSNIKIAFYKDQQEEAFAVKSFSNTPEEGEDGSYLSFQEDFVINEDSSFAIGAHQIAAKLSWTPKQYYVESITHESLPFRIVANTLAPTLTPTSTNTLTPTPTPTNTHHTDTDTPAPTSSNTLPDNTTPAPTRTESGSASPTPAPTSTESHAERTPSPTQSEGEGTENPSPSPQPTPAAVTKVVVAITLDYDCTVAKADKNFKSKLKHDLCNSYSNPINCDRIEIGNELRCGSTIADVKFSADVNDVTAMSPMELFNEINTQLQTPGSPLLSGELTKNLKVEDLTGKVATLIEFQCVDGTFKSTKEECDLTPSLTSTSAATPTPTSTSVATPTPTASPTTTPIETPTPSKLTAEKVTGQKGSTKPLTGGEKAAISIFTILGGVALICVILVLLISKGYLPALKPKLQALLEKCQRKNQKHDSSNTEQTQNEHTTDILLDDASGRSRNVTSGSHQEDGQIVVNNNIPPLTPVDENES